MSKPQPVLNCMPWHVKQKIADEVDAWTKLSLRSCSKEYKRYVDSSKIVYSALVFNYVQTPSGKQSILITLCPYFSEYYFFPEGAGYRKRDERKKWEKLVEDGGDFIDGALKQLMKIFSNPKCVVEYFELQPPNADYVFDRAEVERIHETKRAFLRRLSDHLSRMNRKLKVNEFKFAFDGVQDDLERVLRHFEPGTLKQISIFRPTSLYHRSPERLALGRIAEMRQWKQAEQLLIESYEIGLPISQWSHFRSTTVQFLTISLGELDEIVQAMLRFPKWTKCYLQCGRSGYFNLPEIRRYTQHLKALPQCNPKSKIYQLAKLSSKQNLYIEMNKYRISIFKGQYRVLTADNRLVAI